MIVPAISTSSRTPAIEPGSTRAAATSVSPALIVSRAGGPLSLSITAKAASEMAGSPPVDAARVAAVRAQIVAGTYLIEPERIADAMIALDLPGR